MTRPSEGCEAGKHEYQPRYDEYREPMGFGMVDEGKRYVCDICIRCGKTAKRHG